MGWLEEIKKKDRVGPKKIMNSPHKVFYIFASDSIRFIMAVIKNYLTTLERHPLRWIFWVALIFASRIPFLYGDGLDPDAWRVLLAAKRMALNGGYSCTRDPCHPVVTIFYSWMMPNESWVFNAVTALLSAIGIAAFMETLRRLGHRNYFMTGIACAMTPIIFINSINTMDYLWALSFILIAVFCAVRSLPLLAGILVGLSLGSRFEYAGMIVPICILSYFFGRKSPRWFITLKCLSASIISFFIVYFPAYNRYGTKLLFNKWNESKLHDIELVSVINKATLEIWGGIGFLVLMIMIVLIFFKLTLSKKHKNSEWKLSHNHAIWLIVCALSMLVYTYTFYRLPLESGYLIPVVPFTLALVTLLLPDRVAAIGLIFMCFSPFCCTTSISEKSSSRNEEALIEVRLSDSPDSFLVVKRAGPLLARQSRRVELRVRTEDAIQRIIRIFERREKRVVVVAGTLQPILEVKWQKELGDARFYFVMTRKQFSKEKKLGAVIYVTQRGNWYNSKTKEFDLLEHGATLLNI